MIRINIVKDKVLGFDTRVRSASALTLCEMRKQSMTDSSLAYTFVK